MPPQSSVCLVDGQTLQDAADLFLPSRRLTAREPIHRLVRFLSLLQAIEALLTFDCIQTLPAYECAWRHFPRVARLQRLGAIDSSTLPADLVSSAQEQSTTRLRQNLWSPHFQNFVDEIRASRVEGLYMESARHYSAVREEPFLKFTHDSTIETAWLTDETDYWWLGDTHSGLAPAVAVLASGCYTYSALSAKLATPYLPHCLRAPFALFDDVRAGLGAVSAQAIAMKTLISCSKEAIRNVLGAEHLRCASMPFSPLAALALRRARRAGELVDVIIELRNSGPGRRFRRQLSHLSGALGRGDLPEISRAVEALGADVKRSFDPVHTREKIAISVGIPGFGVEVEVDTPAWVAKMKQSLRRTTIYHMIVSELPTASRLLDDVERLFGRETARAVDDFIPR